MIFCALIIFVLREAQLVSLNAFFIICHYVHQCFPPVLYANALVLTSSVIFHWQAASGGRVVSLPRARGGDLRRGGEGHVFGRRRCAVTHRTGRCAGIGYWISTGRTARGILSRRLVNKCICLGAGRRDQRSQRSNSSAVEREAVHYIYFLFLFCSLWCIPRREIIYRTGRPSVLGWARFPCSLNQCSH